MMNEARVIRRCLSGDTNAFAQLVNRYHRHVLALALNITGDADDARDVAQDSFIQAYCHLNRFDLNKSFKNWLMGITYKRSIDRIRKNKSFLKFMKHYTKVAKTNETSKSRMIEDAITLNPLLKKLKARERTVLYLAVTDSYSAREIGTILGCSESTVRVHIFNARKKLKRELSKDTVFKEPSEVAK